jgi:hypothetical protein
MHYGNHHHGAKHGAKAANTKGGMKKPGMGAAMGHPHVAAPSHGALHKRTPMGKDKMAHESHHVGHGVGTEEGIHGFGADHGQTPPDEYEEGGEGQEGGMGMGENCCQED